MTKREKTLGLWLVLTLVIVVHFVLALAVKERNANQLADLEELKLSLELYSRTSSDVKHIQEEVEWVDLYSPASVSYPKAQTELLDFLIKSSEDLGFSSEQRLITGDDSISAIYERVKIQVVARATEKQIYQWLVKIHQPEEMRIVSFLRLRPSSNDSNLIDCQIIAEQYITHE